MPQSSPPPGKVFNVKKRLLDEAMKVNPLRSTIIVGVSQLDDLLKSLIQQVLLPNAGSEDDLLDGDSPLATFSARIKFARRVGLIDKNFFEALNHSRKIRNAFAHGAHEDAIRESPCKEHLRALMRFLGASKLKDLLRTAKPDAANYTITMLVMCLVFLSARLAAAMKACDRLQIKLTPLIETEA